MSEACSPREQSCDSAISSVLCQVWVAHTLAVFPHHPTLVRENFEHCRCQRLSILRISVPEETQNQHLDVFNGDRRASDGCDEAPVITPQAILLDERPVEATRGFLGRRGIWAAFSTWEPPANPSMGFGSMEASRARKATTPWFRIPIP